MKTEAEKNCPDFRQGKFQMAFWLSYHYSHRKIKLENLRPHEENRVNEHRFLVSSKAHEKQFNEESQQGNITNKGKEKKSFQEKMYS